MSKRIRRILLVCNNYDNFSLEEDGRLDMRIAREYSDLNLSNPPVFERVSSTTEALEKVKGEGPWDVVIAMYNAGGADVFSFAHKVKESAPGTPMVLLTSFPRKFPGSCGTRTAAA